MKRAFVVKSAAEILAEAEQAARNAASWADLSNSLFDPETGLIAKAYPTREERAAFLQTEEYKRIRQLLHCAIERHGLVDGATPKNSAPSVVRLPHSLHAALRREAAAEGVSLDELVVAKLSVHLGALLATQAGDHS
jgi:hypothetical protein